MAIVPNFSTAQSASDLTAVTFTDTSTGSASLTGRLITLRKSDGTYLTPTSYTVSYIFWPYVSGTGDTLTVANLLDKDYCLDISVRWFSGSTADYTKTVLTLFTGYGDVFLRQLTQNAGANRGLISRKNFFENKSKLRCLYDDAAQAVQLLNDQTIAQFCLDDGKILIDHISTFF